MRDETARLARALEWIARLPLCGEPELAGLLGVDEYDSRRLIHLLSAQGWVETVAAASPELEPRRLAVLRDEAVPALAAACGRDLASLADAVPVRPRDLLRRVVRLEITACVNRFAADLAADLESSGYRSTRRRAIAPACRASGRALVAPRHRGLRLPPLGSAPRAVPRGLGPRVGAGRASPQEAGRVDRGERPCRPAVGP